MKFEAYNPQGKVGGVLVYYIEDIDASVGMAFFADDDNNYWSTGFYFGVVRANEDLYFEQISLDLHKADDQWYEGVLGNFGLRRRVFMSTSPEAVLKMYVRIQYGDNRHQEAMI